jgi:RNA polymerase sigma-70 factor (ECF subfamily)
MLDPIAPTGSRAVSAAAVSRAGVPPQSDELPDLLLIERARSGDDRAIEALIRRYSRRLFRVAWSVLLEVERAENAVLEACLAAFTDLSRYPLPGKFAAWLTRLTYNQARALRNPLPTRGNAPDARDRPATGHHELEQAIAGLPEVFRTVYVLRVIEGINGIETAGCLGIHETTVRTRLYRAHRRLDRELRDRLQATQGLLEPSAQFIDRIVRNAPARLPHGSMLTSSASSP